MEVESVLFVELTSVGVMLPADVRASSIDETTPRWIIEPTRGSYHHVPSPALRVYLDVAVGDHPEDIVEIFCVSGRVDLGREIHAALGGNAFRAERGVSRLRLFFHARRLLRGGLLSSHGIPFANLPGGHCTRIAARHQAILDKRPRFAHDHCAINAVDEDRRPRRLPLGGDRREPRCWLPERALTPFTPMVYRIFLSHFLEQKLISPIA
jgi:hypothetical protein